MTKRLVRVRSQKRWHRKDNETSLQMQTYFSSTLGVTRIGSVFIHTTRFKAVVSIVFVAAVVIIGATLGTNFHAAFRVLGIR